MTKLDTSVLAQFTGSENWYRHQLVPSITYTDGAQYLAEQAGAYWLLDEIAIANGHLAKVRGEEFQVWKLKRDAEGHGAELVVEDGNDNVVFRKRIEFTDFPLPEIALWCTGNVIMLPSEY
jgi:Family of unknown function (DUF6876)